MPGGCADAWTLVWSVQVRDPRDSSAHFFNGVATIGFKTDYALRAGIGGVMIWEAGQDCRQHLVAHDDRPQERHVVTCPDGDGRWSLLNAIQRRIDAHYGGGTRPPQPRRAHQAWCPHPHHGLRRARSAAERLPVASAAFRVEGLIKDKI